MIVYRSSKRQLLSVGAFLSILVIYYGGKSILTTIQRNKYRPDSLAIHLILNKYFHKPAFGLPLNLTNPYKYDYSEYGQSIYVDEIFDGKENGTYIECGAGDGETYSNSLFFEIRRKWTGVLIEAGRKNYDLLKMKKRKAILINAALGNKTELVKFIEAGFTGGIDKNMEKSHKKWIFQNFPYNLTNSKQLIQSFRFIDIIEAVGMKVVDYLILDVEGSEITILETIPLSLYVINIIQVEFLVKMDVEKTSRKLDKIKDIILSTNLYIYFDIIKNTDALFIRKDIFYDFEKRSTKPL
ncbi:DgyrCDS14158 [Dimorphilus gyrociliatus]|uniref:DgyrCDS14158 n=1 Tax=Dimorphilus gyrociliatus TaxID=2664684 RepID=A0A7I8WCU6_9ANNE|nr:DgyrCDS14158 [Dimorphilus gyrociliatus]